MCSKAKRLKHIDSFLEQPTEESNVNIHVVDIPPFGCNNARAMAVCRVAHFITGPKVLLKVDAMTLFEAKSDKTGLLH